MHDPDPQSNDPIRTAVLRVVADNPGITIKEVAESVGVRYPVAAYRMRYLVNGGQVKRSYLGRRKGGRGAPSAQHFILASGKRELEAVGG